MITTTVSHPAWTRWVDRSSLALAILAGIATVALMLNVVADVVGRFAFGRPLPGTLDITQFVWMPVLVSLGMGYALQRGEHIRVNLLTAPIGPRTQRVIEIVSMAFTLAVTALMLWFGAEKASSAMGINESAVGSPWLEVWPSRWVVVVGLFALLLQTVATLARAITVEEFHPLDEHEELAALEAEETVFEDMEISGAVMDKAERK